MEITLAADPVRSDPRHVAPEKGAERRGASAARIFPCRKYKIKYIMSLE
jgi:hypothetical protein